MTLQNISNAEIISRMQKLVRTERKITHLVLQYIVEIENRKLYANLGFDGMYSYLTQGLGYSESSAYRRLQSARLLSQVPEIAQKLEDGKLNLTQTTQLQKSIKANEQKGVRISSIHTLELLDKLENKNSFDTEQVLAKELNLTIVKPEKVRPQQDESVRLEITLSKEQFKELQQAKSLLSHVCPDGSWSEVFYALAKNFNKPRLKKSAHFNGIKHIENQDSKNKIESEEVNRIKAADGIKENRENKGNKEASATKENSINFNIIKRKNEETGSSKKVTSEFKGLELQELELQEFKVSESSKFPVANSTQSFAAKASTIGSDSKSVLMPERKSRKAISVIVKRRVFENAQHCCEYVQAVTGRRCSSRYQIQIDHIKPLAKNGSDELVNLRVLCRTHNLLAARQWGIQKL